MDANVIDNICIHVRLEHLYYEFDNQLSSAQIWKRVTLLFE